MSMLSVLEKILVSRRHKILVFSMRLIMVFHILLMDQDSTPADDMVGKLICALVLKEASGVSVAAVGPRYMDVRQNNPPPFIQIRGFRLKRQVCGSDSQIVDVDYLVASGCLIPVTILQRVGGMLDKLFIDYVDIEWGLRAKYYGYQSFGVCGAFMDHALGDTPLEILGKKFPVRSPIRHYYMFRNAMYLYQI